MSFLHSWLVLQIAVVVDLAPTQAPRDRGGDLLGRGRDAAGALAEHLARGGLDAAPRAVGPGVAGGRIDFGDQRLTQDADGRDAEVSDARRYFNLSEDRFTVLALGGSQGAQALNERLLGAANLVDDSVQFLHQSGVGNGARRYPMAAYQMWLAYGCRGTRTRGDVYSHESKSLAFMRISEHKWLLSRASAGLYLFFTLC